MHFLYCLSCRLFLFRVSTVTTTRIYTSIGFVCSVMLKKLHGCGISIMD